MVLRVHGVVPIEGLPLTPCALSRGHAALALAEPAVGRAGIDKPKRHYDQNAKNNFLR
jgi:hypothetical protein